MVIAARKFKKRELMVGEKIVCGIVWGILNARASGKASINYRYTEWGIVDAADWSPYETSYEKTDKIYDSLVKTISDMVTVRVTGRFRYFAEKTEYETKEYIVTGEKR